MCYRENVQEGWGSSLCAKGCERQRLVQGFPQPYIHRNAATLLTVSLACARCPGGQERDAFLNDRRRKEKEKAMGELASFFIGPSREEKERVVEAGEEEITTLRSVQTTHHPGVSRGGGLCFFACHVITPIYMMTPVLRFLFCFCGVSANRGK